jgi:hypothetical protein
VQVFDWTRKRLDQELEWKLLEMKPEACYDEVKNEEIESVHIEVQVADLGQG